MTGYDISDDPRCPACDLLFIPRNGKKVITTVTLVTEGADRVARSSTKELGNIELRFHQNGMGKTPAEIPVVGEVSPPDLTTGRISGAIRFTDDSGSGFCGAITWTLQPR